MDCRTAQDILEIVGPQGETGGDASTASAARHLQTCPQCLSEFRRRRKWDAAIARQMQAVSIPEGLKDRLRDVLAAEMRPASAPVQATPDAAGPAHRGPADRLIAGQEQSTPAALPPQRQAVSRRQWLWFAVSTAASLLAAVGVWRLVVPGTEPRLTWDELSTSGPLLSALAAPETLSEFSGGFEAAVPADWKSGERSLGPVKGVRLSADAQRMAAVFEFSFPMRRRGPVQGLLLALPADWLRVAPEATSFAAAVQQPPVYVGGFPAIAWQESGLAYLCVVKGDHNALKALQDVLSRRSIG